MKRWIAVSLTCAFLAACSGAGGGGNRFLPGNPELPSNALPSRAGAHVAGAQMVGVDRGRHHVRVLVTMRIPHRRRGERPPMHPATISPLTQSVGFAINGAAAQIFNATPSSAGCSASPSGTTCTFNVNAPPGSDTFVVSTYSGTSGGGTILNQGTAVINIVPGTTNSAHLTLGIVVSTTADSGMGSLRYAVATANTGDTIMFVTPSGSVVTLNTPITLSANLTIAGPGVTASARRRLNRHGLHSNTTFSGTTVSGGNASQAFVIKAGVNATISGLIVSGGKASVAHNPGGAIYNAGSLTLSGDAVTDSTSVVTTIVRKARHAHAPQPHLVHGVLAAGPPARLTDDSLRPHACVTSAQYGGGMYNNGVATITNTFFDGNSVANTCTAADAGGSGLGNSGEGGAIFNDTNGSLIISNSTFSNNAAAVGGAIYNNGTAGVVSVTGSTFSGNLGCTSANGCAPFGCSLGHVCSVYANGDGSAIYDGSGPGVTVANSTFTNNVAGGNSAGSQGFGGAIDVEAGSPVITGSTFSGNLAGGGTSNCSYGDGGAISEQLNGATSNSGTVELDNDTFTNNQAGGDESSYGGAIYNGYNPDHGSNNTFTGNSVFGSGSTCQLQAYAEGGAIDAEYGLSMSNSTFTNNTATAAYEIDGGAVYTSHNPSTLSNDTFTGNSGITTTATGEDGYVYGGAIENENTLKIAKSTFTSNVGSANGDYGYYVEGAAVYSYGSLSSIGNTYSSNMAKVPTYIFGYIYGGTMYIDSGGSGGLISSGDTFSNNTSTTPYYIDGGVIYGDSNGLVSINGDTFASNTGTGDYGIDGAGIQLDGRNGSGTNTVANSTFTGNVATSPDHEAWSGALEIDAPTNISGSIFTNNSANAGGGAIGDYNGSGTSSISNSVFTGNTVTSAQSDYGGGAIDSEDTHPIVISNSTFTGNTVMATQTITGGGAIFNYSNTEITGSTFSGNQVLGSVDGTGGGALFDYGLGIVVNSTFTGNSSGVDGGAAMEYPHSNFTMHYTNVTMSGNTATRNGGNIENNDTVDLTSTIVAGGTAGGVGPDIDNAGGTVNSNDYNLVQTTPSPHPIVTPNPDHDIFGQSPGLLALSNNGGPTFTMADTATSPGAAYVPYAGSNCGNAAPPVMVDQRGYTRGAGGGGTKCDIGAFELAGVPSAVKRFAQPYPIRVVPHAPHHRVPKPNTFDPHHPVKRGK